MPIFRRGRRQEEPEPQPQPPTTAEMREAREREWAARFEGPSDQEDYRRTFLRYSPLGWDIVQSTQADLLRLLLERVPADLGVPAIFGLTVVFGDHPKADDATRAALAMIVNELTPDQAHALLAGLSEGWQEAERAPYDERGSMVVRAFRQALKRLQSTPGEPSDALAALAALVDVEND